MTTEVETPIGKWLLSHLINPGRCHICGEYTTVMWAHWTTPTEWTHATCEECAAGEETA